MAELIKKIADFLQIREVKEERQHTPTFKTIVVGGEPFSVNTVSVAKNPNIKTYNEREYLKCLQKPVRGA